ncbi:MAG: hypothetical protein JWO08_3625 [Verrucomicrobiaceae bacterium]|nr:hypothetical protein [Verrucomicrobiaceae bacterium]
MKMTQDYSRLRMSLLTALVACGLVPGCHGPRVHLNLDQQKIAAQLGRIDPDRDDLPARTAVIDVHTHTFNARYLPLEGILEGKRDAYFPVTTLLSDRSARLIARALLDRTELAAIPGQKGMPRTCNTQGIRDSEHPGPLTSVFLDLIDKAISRGAWDPSLSMKQKMSVLDDVSSKMGPVQRLSIQAAANMMGMEDHTKGGTKEADKTVTGIQAAVRFLWMLTQNDAQMAAIFRELHQGIHTKGQITLISHMMDLGPVYAQKPGKYLLDFEKEQVRRMEFYQRKTGAGLHYFVAYNPYRTGTASGGTSALALVQDAVKHHDARGVKVYPPSGYRPFHNDIATRPVTWPTRQPSIQYDQRYERLGKTSAQQNAALDVELNKLLDWCIKEDVPVFVHSGYGEFEARKGYGESNSNPQFWGEFLKAHSQPGRPCRLRLCLGHAGGEDYWFGTGKLAAWGRTAYELCVQYPNVYCEVTTGEAMIDPVRQALFVDRVAQCFAASQHDTPYPFARKLMYGTDWYLPDQGEPAAVLLATQQAFLHPALRPYFAAYFSLNAQKYLKLR